MLLGWLVVWKLAGIEERKLGFPQLYAKVHNGNKKHSTRLRYCVKLEEE